MFSTSKSIGAAATAILLLGLLGCGNGKPMPAVDSTLAPASAARTAGASLAKLKAGNARFVQGRPLHENIFTDRRQALVTGQKPFATVVCCSDSRVPPELVFDQGLGDIFVVRLAGNVVDDVALGSIEYAVVVLGAPLVVVMGHEDCGAVKAALKGGDVPGKIPAVIRDIQPSAKAAKARGLSGEPALQMATDLNVRAGMKDVSGSTVLAPLIKQGKVQVCGGKYLLADGAVQWLTPKP